ncbi:MAG: glutamate-5-semialdehyde dehydrogenase [Rhodospirillaceae bacterium]|nr:glutamate-5-semialdehyde dehydrogenase [Rhodospirillaceae bacterium]
MRKLIKTLGQKARNAFYVVSTSDCSLRNEALKYAAEEIRSQKDRIIDANNKDMAASTGKILTDALRDRLLLTSERVQGMAQSIDEIAELPDPIGNTISKWSRPNGLFIQRVRVPLGVIGIIYEARPNVTSDAGALCLKSGNVAILRGGSESFYSSSTIIECLHQGLIKAGLPEAAIQGLPTTDRAAVGEMLVMPELFDIIIPRGGKSLIKRIQEESRVPIISHLDGNCHIYLHEDASIDIATSITVNAKMRRVGICGATESLLVDQKAAAKLLPPVLSKLLEMGCEIRGDSQTQKLNPQVIPATESDWGQEYLAATISVKQVSGLQQAINHINKFGSQHTDSIVTQNNEAAEIFLRHVDSAIVLHNASTQFADGGEFGMGAEIGISTGRLHARGPVGLEQLTTFKYVVRGNGQVRP